VELLYDAEAEWWARKSGDTMRDPRFKPCTSKKSLAQRFLHTILPTDPAPRLSALKHKFSTMPAPTHLTPSALGQKSYWDTAYTTELTNFSSNSSDLGTIWFSDANAEERMLSFLEDLSDENALNKKDTRFLDLGTGNAHLLFALREDEWEGECVGVDYSGESVRLAESIRDNKEVQVELYQWDILTQEPGTWLAGGFDVVLDKGTFDAICLSQDTDMQGRRVCESYRARVEPLIKPGGRLLITSCNWTDEELRAWFEGGELVYVGKVKYPSFTFGGKTGSSVVTLCFQRKEA